MPILNFSSLDMNKMSIVQHSIMKYITFATAFNIYSMEIKNYIFEMPFQIKQSSTNEISNTIDFIIFAPFLFAQFC